MSNTKVVIGDSFPYAGILCCVLVVLKALGYISWPWIWVFAPIWIPLGILLAIVLGGLILVGVGLGGAVLIEYFKMRRKNRK